MSNNIIYLKFDTFLKSQSIIKKLILLWFNSNFGKNLLEIEICSPDGLKISEVKAIIAIRNSFRNTWRG